MMLMMSIRFVQASWVSTTAVDGVSCNGGFISVCCCTFTAPEAVSETVCFVSTVGWLSWSFVFHLHKKKQKKTVVN